MGHWNRGRPNTTCRVEEFVDIIGPLKPNFTHHPRFNELMRARFVEFGCDLQDTYLDVPRRRVISSHGPDQLVAAHL